MARDFHVNDGCVVRMDSLKTLDLGKIFVSYVVGWDNFERDWLASGVLVGEMAIATLHPGVEVMEYTVPWPAVFLGFSLHK